MMSKEPRTIHIGEIPYFSRNPRKQELYNLGYMRKVQELTHSVATALDISDYSLNPSYVKGYMAASNTSFTVNPSAS